MRPAKFDSELKTLGQDISVTFNLKKVSSKNLNTDLADQFHLALLDCITGLKTFNKKIENLVATGELLAQLFDAIAEDLLIVFQKDNKAAHGRILEAIISTFTQYGSQKYKTDLTAQCQALPPTVWQTGKFNLPAEKLLALLFSEFVGAVKADKATGKKAIKVHADKLYKATELLISTESSLEKNDMDW